MDTPASLSPIRSGQVLNTPVVDASAWRGADLQNSPEWIVRLSEADIAELETALQTADSRGLAMHELTRDSFPLPNLSAKLKTILRDVEYGRGFVLIRGIQAERYSKEAAGRLFWGLGAHLGDGVTQNAKGDLLGHVADRGYADYRGRSDVRGYQTRANLEFHTDVVDVVGLMCLRKAKEGGESLIVSSTAIHNEMLRQHPLLLGLLYGNFLFDRKGEEAEGQAPYFVSPVYSYFNGFLSCRPAVIEYIFSAAKKTGIALSPAQREALDVFVGYAMREDLQLSMHLEPGDIQLLNNSVILHSRTSFLDHEEPDRRRHLLRLWLNVPDGRPVDAAAFPYRIGVPVVRSVAATHRA
jgi:hypothetical protein